jgi:hypothetical protein
MVCSEGPETLIEELAMDHDSTSCIICVGDNDLTYDPHSRFHFRSTDLENDWPVFRLYPLVSETAEAS